MQPHAIVGARANLRVKSEIISNFSESFGKGHIPILFLSIACIIDAVYKSWDSAQF